MLLSALLWWLGIRDTLTMLVGPAIALAAVAVTALVLVVDLERPERFYYILVRPNWRSWMVWGAYFLTAHGGLCTLWLLAGWFGWSLALSVLVVPVIVMSVLATSYTGFLFAQGLARDLWQGPHAAVDLLAQALAEGSAVLLLAVLLLGAAGLSATTAAAPLSWVLLGALGAHLLFIVFENLLAPSPSRHHELATGAIRHGAFSRLFWGGAIAAGGVVPIALLAIALAPADHPLLPAIAVAALLALAGNFAWEYIWVEAGQSVPLS